MDHNFNKVLGGVTVGHVILLVGLFIFSSRLFNNPKEQVTMLELGMFNVRGIADGNDRGGGGNGIAAPVEIKRAPKAEPEQAAPEPKVQPTIPEPTPAEPSVVQNPVTAPQPVVTPVAEIKAGNIKISSEPKVEKPANVRPVIKVSDKVISRGGAASSSPTRITPSNKVTKRGGESTGAGTDANQDTESKGTGIIGPGQGSGNRVNGVGQRRGTPAGVTDEGVYGDPNGGHSDHSEYMTHLQVKMQSAWEDPGQPISKTNVKPSIQIHISRDGQVSGHKLVRSSGDPILDEAALAAAKRVVQVKALPQGLGDDSGYTVPVAFDRQ